MTKTAWPRRTRDVLNHHQDSSNWDAITLREGDIVAANWAKAGITWLQQIMVQLVHQGSPDQHVANCGIWPDWWTIPKPALKDWTNSMSGRRIFKTHLPADALNLSPKARYIYIGRDARDVVWSFYPHLRNYAPELIALVNSAPHRDWPEWGPPTTDIRQFYHDWLDQDGAPYWPFWSHTQSWWDVRGLPNVMLIHHQNLKDDREGRIRDIARFLDIEIETEAWPRILEHCSFDWMKANREKLLPINSFIDKGASFMNKGVNGRWRDVLTAQEIQRCDDVAAQNLTPECAHWLKTGELPA